jgi:ATP-dependent Clp endopeptidase proteolytic subunit ClpP
MTERTGPVPAYVHRANEKKLLAEAAQKTAEAAKDQAVADSLHITNTASELDLSVKQHGFARIIASDAYHQVYRFTGGVDSGTAEKAISELSLWDRIDPAAPWHIVFNSPGGDVVPGLALFDFLVEQAHRHHVTTIALGYAASMGGILLQAGTTRLIGRESWVLIHEVSAGMMGSYGDLEDRMKWLTKVQDRILDIFTERSNGKKTKDEFENAWKRKDFWLDSEAAVEWGVVDGVV